MPNTPHPVSPDADTVEQLVAAAGAAPSIHNTQPWRFRFRPETSVVEVRAAFERMLPAEDPSGRALHLSVGAALCNLRIAAGALGWQATVALLPDQQEPDLLAVAGFAGTRRARDTVQERLHEAVWLRRTSRQPFDDRPVPLSSLTHLAEAANAEGAALYVPTREEGTRLLALTAKAQHRNVADPQRLAESRAWAGQQAHEGLGVPATALGPQDASGLVPVRDFTGTRPRARYAFFERRPQLAVLLSTHDEPVDWLRAGQAMERVLLTATVNGIQSSPLHQALEWPDLREALRHPHRGLGNVQMLLRLGFARPGPSTPRLAVDAVLDDTDSLRAGS